MPIFSLTWIDGYLINGCREREVKIMLIIVKTNERVVREGGERENI